VCARNTAVAADFTLTTDTCPVCSTAQQQRWQFIIANQLGVGARDPDGEYIGIWNAGRWEPQHTYKQTMCGRLADFSFYNPWYSGDEADWNEYMVPSAPFQYLIDEAKLRNGGDTEDWNHERVIVNGQPQDRLAVEAEITPDEHFYENPWVSASAKDSALVGSDLCTYGPSVIDTGHNNRPEIHPSELHWWRAGTFTYMLNMQDDSNRYDNRGDYDLGFEPDTWRPWSQFPRTGEFSIAVSLTAGRVLAPFNPPRFEVSTDYLRNLAFTSSADADDGAEHGLTYNGTRLLSVVEGGPVADPAVDRYVRVGFNFCRRPGANPLTEQLLGYVTLTSRVGLSDDGNEGVHLFKVRRVNDTGPGNAVVRRIARERRPGLIADPRWLPSTLRSQRAGQEQRLVADLELVARPGRKARAGDRDITGVRVTGTAVPARRALRRGSTARSVRVSLPVTSRAAVRLTTRSGKTAVLDAEGLAPVLLDARDVPTTSAGAPADPATVAAALGVPGGSVPGASIVRNWDVSVAAMYAPVRHGAPSPEDDSPLSEALNEALRERGDRARTLFGTTEPLKVRWSFTARDAVSGQTVPVRVNRAAAASEIEVRTDPPTRRLRVRFPGTGAVYRLTATARTRDAFGARAATRHQMTNVVLTGADQPSLASSVLASVARLAGVASNLFGESPLAGVPPFDPSPSDVAATLPRWVGLLAYQAAEDRRVDLAEFAQVLRAARRVRPGG
jgi:hypothetical protein